VVIDKMLVATSSGSAVFVLGNVIVGLSMKVIRQAGEGV